MGGEAARRRRRMLKARELAEQLRLYLDLLDWHSPMCDDLDDLVNELDSELEED